MDGLIEDRLGDVIRHHTKVGEHWLSSGVRADYYIDLRDALLCASCHDYLVDWYQTKIMAALGDHRHEQYAIVATGHFGALLLGALAQRGGRGALYNEKGHGRMWAGVEAERINAVLVDDVVTSGATLARLRVATEARGWSVIGEVVARQRAALEGVG